MTTLHYAFGTLSPHDSFADASPWQGDLDGWHVRLDGAGLTATTEQPFSDQTEARADLQPRLRAWEAAVYLRDGLEIYFGERPASGRDRERIVRTVNRTYPGPEPGFAITDEVRRLIATYDAFVDGTRQLPDALRDVLDVIDAKRHAVGAHVVAAAREVAERPENARYRGPEWQWMQEALRLLTLRAGRAGDDAPREPLSMTDFRSEL